MKALNVLGHFWHFSAHPIYYLWTALFKIHEVNKKSAYTDEFTICCLYHASIRFFVLPCHVTVSIRKRSTVVWFHYDVNCANVSKVLYIDTLFTYCISAIKNLAGLRTIFPHLDGRNRIDSHLWINISILYVVLIQNVNHNVYLATFEHSSSQNLKLEQMIGFTFRHLADPFIQSDLFCLVG